MPWDLAVLPWGLRLLQPRPPQARGFLPSAPRSLRLGVGAHGWVAGIASHGSVSLSRGWLISVEAPRHRGHLSSIQLDAVVNF